MICFLFYCFWLSCCMRGNSTWFLLFWFFVLLLVVIWMNWLLFVDMIVNCLLVLLSAIVCYFDMSLIVRRCVFGLYVDIAFFFLPCWICLCYFWFSLICLIGLGLFGLCWFCLVNYFCSLSFNFVCLCFTVFTYLLFACWLIVVFVLILVVGLRLLCFFVYLFI